MVAVGSHEHLIRHGNFEGIRRQTRPLITGYFSVSGPGSAFIRCQDRPLEGVVASGSWRCGEYMMHIHLSLVLVLFMQMSWRPELERNGSRLRRR